MAISITPSAIKLLQLAGVVKKNFANGDRYQPHRLPAYERRPLPEAGDHHRRSIDDPDGGKAEIARDFQLPRGLIRILLLVKLCDVAAKVIVGFTGKGYQRQQVQRDPGHLYEWHFFF